MHASVTMPEHDINSKEWRTTALRARAQRSGPVIAAVALLCFVVTVVTCAAMADHKAEVERKLGQLDRRAELKMVDRLTRHHPATTWSREDVSATAQQQAAAALERLRRPSQNNGNDDDATLTQAVQDTLPPGSALAQALRQEQEGWEDGEEVAPRPPPTQLPATVDSDPFPSLVVEHGQEQASAEHDRGERREQAGADDDRDQGQARPWTRGDPAQFGERQAAVAEAVKWAWKGYKQCAWGKDDLLPLSCKGGEWFDLGITLVDSLDLLWLVGMDEEFQEAKDWVANDLSIRRDEEVNLFEATIRVLGGLLSAYFVSGDGVFRERAAELGEALSPAFQSKTSVPHSDVNLLSGRANNPGGDSSLAEATSVQLEFKYLAHVTGDEQLAVMANEAMDAVLAARTHLHNNEHAAHGLLPIYLGPGSGRFQSKASVTLGARGDSYYEYLLKQWLFSGKRDAEFLAEYQRAMRGVREVLVRDMGGFTFVGEILNGDDFSPKMDHLVCFLPGTLALGYWHGADDSDTGDEHLRLAQQLMRTCMHGHELGRTGLAPEIWWFRNSDGPYIKSADAFSLLRPESAESLFYLWRITRDPIYRQWGWDLFQALETHAKVADGGYASIEDVREAKPKQRDKMESFFLAETLKYLFLLFDDADLLPLDRVVFNTEAHPFPLPEEEAQSGGS